MNEDCSRGVHVWVFAGDHINAWQCNRCGEVTRRDPAPPPHRTRRGHPPRHPPKGRGMSEQTCICRESLDAAAEHYESGGHTAQAAAMRFAVSYLDVLALVPASPEPGSEK